MLQSTKQSTKVGKHQDISPAVEEAIALADALIFAKTKKHLSTLQVAIFRGAWCDRKYDQIARSCYCSEAHIKMSGSALWELLSQALEEKVTKKTFRAALERRQRPAVQSPGRSSSPTRDAPTLANCSAPIAELEFPEGQVKLNSAFYIERPPLESRCYDAIAQPGSLLCIQAPRQMGKSSLLARLLHHAELRGDRAVSLNLQLADRCILQDLNLFLRWLCANVSRELKLPNRLPDYWDKVVGPKVSCKDYFEQYLLPQLDSPLVLGLDEVNRLFPYPQVADDVFALLRAWHEEAKNNATWQKLRLVVVHSTDVDLPLAKSSFNVGLSIELPEFTPEQVRDLARRHGLDWDLTQVMQLMEFVGGQPYLVRLALYDLARNPSSLEALEGRILPPLELYSDHLQQHWWQLEQKPDLAASLATIVRSNSPIRLESWQAFKLHGMGLVCLQGDRALPRCELYRQYFRDRLGAA